MSELRVDLAAFQGPLDLLLHLVQQEEVEITEIPLARVADRFLETVREQAHTLDVDEAGEYLVLASQLLVLKSRALLPRDAPVDLEEIDPRLDLVKQLLEYRGFKEVAGTLRERAAEQAERVGVQVQGPDPIPLAEEELEVDLFALVSAFRRLLRETGEDTAVAMPRERLPITHFVGVMFDRLEAAGGRLSFEELLAGSRDRTYVIGAFLALLELIKLRKVLVTQDGLGEIRVEVRPEGLEVTEATEQDLATQTIEQPELGGAGRARVVFMGSPAFAVPALESLVGAGFAPVLVVVPPPRPAGRGRRKQAVAVDEAAVRLELAVHRTGDVNGRTSREAIEEATPDVIVTAGFGQKLGGALLALPRRGCVNLHASLLPRYRGASPVAAALRDGVVETGVTLFVMGEELDRGPVVASRTLPLTGEETTDEVTAALADLAADLLVRTLPDYIAGAVEPVPQDEAEATYVKRLTKEDGRVPWASPAIAVKNHVRAVTSWPGAQTAWQPKVKHDPFPVVLLETAVVGEGDTRATAPAGNGDPTPAEHATPGTVLHVSEEGIDVACGEGVLRIVRLRPAGGRPMAVRDFLNARRVVAGDRFL
jgi:methionyl-tRNA formyltransferase